MLSFANVVAYTYKIQYAEKYRLLEVIDGIKLYVITCRKLQAEMRETETAAFVIGEHIVFRTVHISRNKKIRAHEFCHVAQVRKHLFFSLWYYLYDYFYGYENNPYEVEARTWEEMA